MSEARPQGEQTELPDEAAAVSDEPDRSDAEKAAEIADEKENPAQKQWSDADRNLIGVPPSSGARLRRWRLTGDVRRIFG